MTLSTSIVRAFAPTGALRASINTGNPILAAPDGDGSAKGVSVDLARRLPGGWACRCSWLYSTPQASQSMQ